MAGRTTLVSAHRLSTIQRADLILVLDKGRIVEAGTPAQLLAVRGHYYQFYTLQFGAQEPWSPVQPEVSPLNDEGPVLYPHKAVPRRQFKWPFVNKLTGEGYGTDVSTLSRPHSSLQKRTVR